MTVRTRTSPCAQIDTNRRFGVYNRQLGSANSAALLAGGRSPSAVGRPMGASQGPTSEYAAGNLLEAARLSDAPFIRSRPETLRPTNYND